jgi:hypothetical protein
MKPLAARQQLFLQPLPGEALPSGNKDGDGEQRKRSLVEANHQDEQPYCQDEQPNRKDKARHR